MVADVEEIELEKAIAYYPYMASKDVRDEEAGRYRAAALALIGKPADAGLLRDAAKGSPTMTLCAHELRGELDLEGPLGTVSAGSYKISSTSCRAVARLSVLSDLGDR